MRFIAKVPPCISPSFERVVFCTPHVMQRHCRVLCRWLNGSKYTRARVDVHQGLLAASRPLLRPHVQQHSPPGTPRQLQPPIDLANGNLNKLHKAVEAAEVEISKAGLIILELEFMIRCLKHSVGKNRNLTDDEYRAFEADADDRIDFDYVRSATTLILFTKDKAKQEIEKAEVKIEKAEVKIEKAEVKIKDAKQEIKEAKQEIKDADKVRNTIKNTPFVWDATLSQKKRLIVGPGVSLLGGLYGRSKGLMEIKEGYKKLASHRGVVRSKKDIPIIACASLSGAGKTEMLTHVVNTHGHFPDGDNSKADEILNMINNASPMGSPPLAKLVTFFCSFNGDSTYVEDEDPVLELTTVERMVRVYSGKRPFSYNSNMSFDVRFQTLLDAIPDDVGVIICLDEIALVENLVARRALLLAAMTCCEAMIGRGRFVAIVASSLHFYVWNDTVFSGSNRTIHPFTLQALPKDESLLLAIGKTLTTKYLQTNHPEDKFTINVIARILSQECKPQQWVNYFSMYMTLVHPTPTAILPGDNLEESTVFEWIAPAITGGPCVMIRFAQNERLVKALYARYGEYVISQIGTESDTLQGEMRLPAVRFLQLSWGNCKYVRGWTQRALADCVNAQSVNELRKRWELGTIALLEVWRCAMRAMNPSTTFKLKDLPIFKNWDKDEECNCVVRLANTQLMEELLPNEPLSVLEVKGTRDVGVWHSPNDNTAGIEGTMRFSDALCLSYQMKLVESKVDASKLKEWCRMFIKHGDSATIFLLFVTNVTTESVRNILESLQKDELPSNLIIVTEPAVVDLVRPFGAGTLASFLVDDKELRATFRKSRV